MKKGLLYIFLFFYVAVQLLPLTAIVEDVLAHTFFKMQHMATIHYENGKYHLHTELNTIAAEEGNLTKDKIVTSEKYNENLTNQFSLQLNFDLSTKTHRLSAFIHPNGNISSGFLSITSPPPQVV